MRTQVTNVGVIATASVVTVAAGTSDDGLTVAAVVSADAIAGRSWRQVEIAAPAVACDANAGAAAAWSIVVADDWNCVVSNFATGAVGELAGYFGASCHCCQMMLCDCSAFCSSSLTSSVYDLSTCGTGLTAFRWREPAGCRSGGTWRRCV